MNPVSKYAIEVRQASLGLSSKARRCPECSGVGSQVYGLMGNVARLTCSKCHGAGRLVVKSRRRALRPDPGRFYFSESSLRVEAEELQRAIKWRDLSRGPCSAEVRRLTRAAMRRAALNSRTSYAGGLIQAN